MLGSHYGVCVQLIMEEVVSVAEAFGSNEALAFIHEENDYTTEATEAYKAVKERRRRHYGPMTLAFGSKAEFVPLHAADVLAFETNKRLRNTATDRTARIRVLDDTRNAKISRALAEIGSLFGAASGAVLSKRRGR